MDDNTGSGGCVCQRMPLVDDRGSVSRRGVLTGSAAAIAALALGACAASDEATVTRSSPSGASEPPTEPASQSPSEATPSRSASAEGTPTGEVIAVADFPVGGGVVVPNTAQGPIVVTHPNDEDYKGFNGRCPHAGCPVGEVLENTIMCNCHGSTFDAATGDRLGGPAPRGLEPVAIEVSNGEIYLA